MYCIRCGNQVRKEDRYCYLCGYCISDDNKKENKSKDKNWSMILGIIACCLFFNPVISLPLAVLSVVFGVRDRFKFNNIGIVLGKALLEALGDKKGINRYADTILPMDESLILTALDVSGRSYLGFDVVFPTEKIGDFDTELVEEFFMALTRCAEITLHIKKMAGENSHHIAEGIFKSFARSLRTAVALDENFKDQLPSTKGVL